MQPQEKQILLREIELWRTSRLLPKEYCDFLTNLYLEGEKTAEQVAASASSTLNSGHSFGLKKAFRIVLLAVFVTLALTILLEFHTFSFRIQAYIVAGVASLMILLSSISKNSLTRLVYMGILSLAFVIEAYIVDRMFDWPLRSSQGILSFLAAFCGWIVVGSVGRSKWIASLGLIMLEFLLNTRFLQLGQGHADYLHEHLYAVGLMIVCSIIAKWTIQKRVTTSVCWLIGALFALFLPDINGWTAGNMLSFLWQGILFLKVFVLTGVLVVWRQRIISWWKL